MEETGRCDTGVWGPRRRGAGCGRQVAARRGSTVHEEGVEVRAGAGCAQDAV